VAAAGRDLPPLLLHESDQLSKAALQVSERTVVAPLLGQALDDHPAVLRMTPSSRRRRIALILNGPPG
jgi:hypothetical protein